MQDPTQRFSNRVENYVRYRPSYPGGVLDLLQSECGLAPGAPVADVGSGTGILSSLLLERGARVYGVEPNREMREAAESRLRNYERFVSVEGTAEETGLPGSHVALVTVGQAFHWFDVEGARREFGRILAPGGYAALVWNRRKTDATPFLRDYERLLLEYGTDYEGVARRESQSLAAAHSLFSTGSLRERAFGNRQDFGREELRGRTLSSSFVPGPEEAAAGPMLFELERLFDEHQSGGKVAFEYDVRVLYGRIAAGG